MNQKQYYYKHIDNVCERLGISETDYLLFRRRGATLHRLYEEQCNGYQDYRGNEDTKAVAKAVARSEAKENRYYKLVKDQATKLGLHVFFQTDPRGATIYLDKNPIEANNYNRAHYIY